MNIRANELLAGFDRTKAIAYPQMIQNLFKEMDTFAASTIHAAVGMTGEAGEIMDAVYNEQGSNDLCKEMGDFRFYMQKLWNMFGWTPESFTDIPLTSGHTLPAHIGLSIAACNVQDVLKKHWVYNSELNTEKLFEHMHLCWHYYLDLCKTFDFNDDLICLVNQAKLAKRYPNGVYSDVDAQTRKDMAS